MRARPFWRRGMTAGSIVGLLLVTGCGGHSAAPSAGKSVSSPSSPSLASPAAPATSAASAAPATSAATTAPATEVLPTGTGAAPAPAAASQTALPVQISIPAIGVVSSLQALGLLKDGTLQVPTEWQQAGWYADGVRPGDPGPAVIAGHVDSVNGPAIFFRLKQLHVGDTATVKQSNGHLLSFVIDTLQEYPKNQFPTAAVYGPTATPVLRLITCTGDFDRAAHSYVDNLVVTAHLVA